MDYQVLYTAERAAFPWAVCVFGVLMALGGVLDVVFAEQLSRSGFRAPAALRTPGAIRVFGVCVCLFALALTALLAGGTLGQQQDDRYRLEYGHYHEVEGPLEAFVPEPVDPRLWKSFSVRGVRFASSDWPALPFSLAGGRDGLRAGLSVKIRYVAEDALPSQHRILWLGVRP